MQIGCLENLYIVLEKFKNTLDTDASERLK